MGTPALDQTQSEISERNTKKVENTASAAVRYGDGLRAAASIATAAWKGVEEITQGNTNLAICHNNIKRAQKKLMKLASEEFSKFVSTDKIDCIFWMVEST